MTESTPEDSADTEEVLDVVEEEEEGYGPDPDYDIDPDDSDGAGPAPLFPQPRAAALRKGILQRNTPKTKKPRSVSKGGGRILAKEKQRKALELRKMGASYQAIADAIGYSDQSAARKAVVKAFQDVIQEPALEVKAIQIERLNHMLLTLWPKVQNGDERSIDTSLRVMDKIDRLMGTEAAQTVDINVNQQNAILVVDGDKDDYLRALKQMAGIAGDGTNRTAIGPGQQDSITMAPPTGIVDGEVVIGHLRDGETLADALGPEGVAAIHSIMAPPSGTDGDQIPYVPSDTPARTYDFGVEPTKKE